MRRATRVLPAGQWATGEQVATVTLAWAERHRRRLRMCDDEGEAFLLDLERAASLCDGDGLTLQGGGVICVRAADEAVLDVWPETAAEAARLAWHLGNRHAPVQVLACGRLRLLEDPVLADMLRGLGAAVRLSRAPFAPETGAYGGQAAHTHGESVE
jgi:urease accessory protein